jgi:predicted nuclease with RNAse H fold
MLDERADSGGGRHWRGRFVIGIDAPVSNQQRGNSVIREEPEFVKAKRIRLPPAQLIGHSAEASGA